MTWTPTISNCDSYLNSRTGKYEWRRTRYMAALKAMQLCGGLTDQDTVLDVGAGWTELDFCLRVDGDWKGRYIPLDGGIDGTDLDHYMPSRTVDWVVALEIIEHLHQPVRLMQSLMKHARKGMIVSTPNPRTTDVLGMDPTHVTMFTAEDLTRLKFTVQETSFYGQPDDSLFGVWTR